MHATNAHFSKLLDFGRAELGLLRFLQRVRWEAHKNDAMHAQTLVVSQKVSREAFYAELWALGLEVT